MTTTVGVADLKFSSRKEDILVTYALGSCLGITVYDPVAVVGGMLHAMLPLSSADPKKAIEKPQMFVDTGFGILISELYRMGAKPNRLIISAAGGASMKQVASDDYFKIGQRNFTVLRKLLWKNGFMLHAQDIGGGTARTMSFRLEDGLVLINKRPIQQESAGQNVIF
jgi:chemotaxis protein CheD